MLKKRYYTITWVKRGRDFKKCIKNNECLNLNDDKLYKMTWTVNGTLFQVLKAKYNLKHNKPGKFEMY